MTDTVRISPGSLEEAAEALTTAVNSSTPVRFAGSGSRAGLGSVEDCPTIMDTASMTSVIDWLVEDLTVVVGAGMRVGELETLLATKNQTTLLPTAEPRRTVGGLIAEGASGFERLKYGPTRDRTLEVTMATGYGKVVRGGGRLVKNVTGYDLPRLATGSLGSLGFLGSVCLKLWPIAPVRRAVATNDPARVHRELFRPVAVLETEAGSVVMVEGSESDVAAQVALAGAGPDVALPEPIGSAVLCSLRVPPRNVSATVERLQEAHPERFTAQHGVGVIDVGFDSIDADLFLAVRAGIEETGGSAVILRPGDSLLGIDPWGTPPSTVGIQRRMKELFDPSRVCNPGILPGGI